MVLALATVGAAAVAQPNASAARPIAVVMITDCGADIDDQWALTHLLLTRNIDVKAIVTTHAVLANLTSETTQRCVNDVLEHVRSRRSQWPAVARGSDGPIQPHGTPPKDAGTELLLAMSRGFSTRHRLTVLVSGAATELASAIQREPSIVNRISVVAMGFEDWDSGDEFNVKNDPAAWRAVLAADVPLVIGSAAVTKRDLRLDRDDAARLIGGHGPIGAYLNGLFDAWLDAHPELVSKVVASNTWVIWDDVVTAYLLGMTHGEQRQRPVLRADLGFDHPATARRLTWLTSIDAERVWNDLAKKIDAARPTPLRLSHGRHGASGTRRLKVTLDELEVTPPTICAPSTSGPPENARKFPPTAKIDQSSGVPLLSPHDAL
jgi:inosine-uridine nucleoside N-ribohydrolase